MQEEITESELNSEVELLNSQDLLRKVAIANGLQQTHLWLSNDEVGIAKAVRGLGKHLKAEPLRKTNVIAVTYESSDPEQSARVLSSVASVYMEKHLQVHRHSGEFKFFDQETSQLRQGSSVAEERLNDFTRDQGVVSAPLERDLTLQKIDELDGSVTQTEATIAETKKAYSDLRTADGANSASHHYPTSNRRQSPVVRANEIYLLQLELKRTELLSKFEPTYRPVQDLEKQINETHAAIDGEKNSPIRDETTDQNPIFEWVKSELAKARTDLSGLEARASSNQIALAKYREGAQTLQQASIVQQDLQRAAKTEEENYLLYLRKAEEARMNDALDRGGILNVAIAESPTVPAIPTPSVFLVYLIVTVIGRRSLRWDSVRRRLPRPIVPHSGRSLRLPGIAGLSLDPQERQITPCS